MLLEHNGLLSFGYKCVIGETVVRLMSNGFAVNDYSVENAKRIVCMNDKSMNVYITNSLVWGFFVTSKGLMASYAKEVSNAIEI